MTNHDIPSPDGLKAQARRLRETMSASGTEMSHAAALEAVARQHGFRNWNTAQAAAKQHAPVPRWQVGQQVRGAYLGHPFTGRIKAARQNSGDFWRLTLVFDTPVDVVASPRFSSLRRQVSVVLNGRGVTPERISDGTPHMELFAA